VHAGGIALQGTTWALALRDETAGDTTVKSAYLLYRADDFFRSKEKFQPFLTDDFHLTGSRRDPGTKAMLPSLDHGAYLFPSCGSR